MSVGTFINAGIVAHVPAPLFGVVGQIQWAEHQIELLKTDIEAFESDQPYFLFSEFDYERDEIVFKYASHPIMPYDFSPRIGSIISTMVSAMDYLAVQLVRTSRKPFPKGKIYFPVRDERKEFETALRDTPVIQAMRHGSKKRLRAAKPYEKGNYAIWLAHHLSKRVKHNDPIYLDTEFFLVKSNKPPKVIFFDQFNIHKAHGYFVPTPNQAYIGAIPIGHFSDVTGLMKLPFQQTGYAAYRLPMGKNLKPDQNIEFGFRISLADPVIIRDQPIIPTLYNMAETVRNILESFYTLFSGPSHVPAPKYTLTGN